jgi:hypothetical protein
MSRLKEESDHEFSRSCRGDEEVQLSEPEELDCIVQNSFNNEKETHKEIKEELNKGISEIKRHLKERRKRYKKELNDRIKVIEKNEQQLSNISERFKDRWKAIQKKTLFLSLLRRILRNARNFGIDPRKLPEVAVNSEENVKKWSVIYPESTLYKAHIFLLLLIFFYLVIFFPLDLAFNINDDNYMYTVADYFITAYFGFDIIISFFTAYFKEGVVVDSNRQIALNYLLKWFLLDLITVIPFDIIFQLDNFNFKRLFKLPRMMRLFNTIFQNTESKKKTRGFVLEKLKALIVYPKVYHIVSSLMFTCAFIHISACLWCMLLSISEEEMHWEKA